MLCSFEHICKNPDYTIVRLCTYGWIVARADMVYCDLFSGTWASQKHFIHASRSTMCEKLTMVSGSLMANLETQRARSENWAATSSAATKTGYKL